MLRRLICIVGTLLLVSGEAGAQATMDDYTKRLFFNLFTGKPDTSIRGFLNLYIPALSHTKTPGKWINYAPADTTHAHEEIHSFIFKNHPFINEKFARGRLDFSCRRYEGAQVMQNITGIQLWFEFDTLEEAEVVFARLVEMFILVSSNKKITTINGLPRAAFINTNNPTGFSKVQVIMMADTISVHKYKVLFETGNDL